MIPIVLLLAQLHVATPAEKLRPHTTFRSEVPAAPEGFNRQAARTFDVVARQFDFVFSGEPQVEVGDSVTLKIRATDVTHGFFLESYMTQGVTILPGQEVSVSFIANTPGTFTYFCSIFCGEGHSVMSGRLTVSAKVAEAPKITAVTPRSGAITGGTPVSITGSGFVAGATVQFGSSNALVTIVNSPTSITVITPAADPGAVMLRVVNPDGQATAPAVFTFGSQPADSRRRRAVRR